MLSFLIRAAAVLLNLVIGEPSGPREPGPEQVRSHLERWRDPYFQAFLARCWQWVYDQDPRRAIEQVVDE